MGFSKLLNCRCFLHLIVKFRSQLVECLGMIGLELVNGVGTFPLRFELRLEFLELTGMTVP